MHWPDTIRTVVLRVLQQVQQLGDGVAADGRQCTRLREVCQRGKALCARLQNQVSSLKLIWQRNCGT